jgi:predicted molibdopterin-dependent oxidoreductase YjgC
MSVPHDDAISDGWLCDRGRYNVGFYEDARRLTSPLLRRGTEFVQIGGTTRSSCGRVSFAKRLRPAGVERAGALGGGRLLNEEIVLLERTLRASRRRRTSIGARAAAAGVARGSAAERTRISKARS